MLKSIQESPSKSTAVPLSELSYTREFSKQAEGL